MARRPPDDQSAAECSKNRPQSSQVEPSDYRQSRGESQRSSISSPSSHVVRISPSSPWQGSARNSSPSSHTTRSSPLQNAGPGVQMHWPAPLQTRPCGHALCKTTPLKQETWRPLLQSLALFRGVKLRPSLQRCRLPLVQMYSPMLQVRRSEERRV